jgi:two-component system response regulator NreC
MSSFEATRQIRKDRPETHVIFLSMYDDDEYLAESMQIGVDAYVLKESPVEQLLTAVREVYRGGSYLSARLLTRLVADFRTHGTDGATEGMCRPRLGSLTKREHEILKMLAEGKSVKEIATGFELSVKTVEAHKFNLMRKLDIHNKAQLVQYAIRKKIIRLPEAALV